MSQARATASGSSPIGVTSTEPTALSDSPEVRDLINARLRSNPTKNRTGAARSHLGALPSIFCRPLTVRTLDYDFKTSDIFDGDIPFGEMLPVTTEHFGRMFYPAGLIAKGLVVITHGSLGNNVKHANIYSRGFDYLLCSLASKGFVAVSIKSVPSTEERARIMRLHLRWLAEKVTVAVGIKGITSKPLVLIGQSEAGGSTVRVASQISSGKGPRNGQGAQLYTKVAAVIGLNPGGANDDELQTSFADAYLAFSGSNDGDPGVGPGGGVLNVDNAISINRYLIYIHGGFHTGWCDPLYPESAAYYKGEYSIDPANRILPETQNLVFKTYIGLFLEGLLKGDLAAMRVFRGGEQPILQSGNSLVIDDIKKRLRVCPMSAEFSQFLAPPNNYVFFKFLDDVPKFGAAKDVGTLSFQREKVYRLRWCYAPI